MEFEYFSVSFFYFILWQLLFPVCVCICSIFSWSLLPFSLFLFYPLYFYMHHLFTLQFILFWLCAFSFNHHFSIFGFFSKYFLRTIRFCFTSSNWLIILFLSLSISFVIVVISVVCFLYFSSFWNRIFIFCGHFFCDDFIFISFLLVQIKQNSQNFRKKLLWGKQKFIKLAFTSSIQGASYDVSWMPLFTAFLCSHVSVSQSQA